MQILLPPSDLDQLVFWSASLATFIGSVMASEQSERLRNGTFGAVAGVSVGSFAALMSGGAPRFVLVGLFGSAIGALAGWVFFVILAIFATFSWGRRVVEYLIGGVGAVRSALQLDQRRHLSSALNGWCVNFRRIIDLEIAAITPGPSAAGTAAPPEPRVKAAIQSWLHAVIDVVNLVYDVLAEKPEYGARITVIRFQGKGNDAEGQHWASYSGKLPHHKPKVFTSESYAHKVLLGTVESPHFVHTKDANEKGQKRSEPDSAEYQTFVLFKLTDDAVLSFDWPGAFQKDEPHVSVITEFLQLDLAPAIGRLLKLSVSEDPPGSGGSGGTGAVVQLPPETAIVK